LPRAGRPLALLTRNEEVPAALLSARPLPAVRSSLIGRDRDVAAVCQLLLRGDVRLLTLTGAGGSGKTRLALQSAAEAEPDFAGGVYVIALGSVTEPGAVAREIAHAFGLRQTKGQPLIEALQDHLRVWLRQPTLLVLDNFEQLIAAAPVLVALLDACALLKILVTSRTVLRVSGEFGYSVPPLPVPSLEDGSCGKDLLTNPAVTLFVQRATAIAPAFDLDPENAAAVAEICVRLDGLPLALELAAARIKVLTPAEMCARLESRLDLLTGGAADLPARQQTLRSTLEWSHALLTPAEQRLFRRLSVFSGGCTLEGAEAVCNTRRDLGVSILDGVSSLLDKSLIHQVGEIETGRRFAMLETVREFAREQLDRAGETNAARHAHAAYSLVLAEEVALRKTPAELADWLQTCDAAHDNHRVALAYLCESARAEWALRLGVSLYRYWEHREYLAEGRAALEAVLVLPHTAAHAALRARALGYAGSLASHQGDHDVAFPRHHEALETYRELGDRKGVVAQLNSLAACERFRGNYRAARRWSEQTVLACREEGDKAAIAAALSNLAGVVFLLGEHREAQALLHEASAMFAGVDDASGMAWCCNHLGDIALELGDAAEARRLYEAGADIFRAIGDRWGLARSACDLGYLACESHDSGTARACFQEAANVFAELGHKRGIASALDGFARLALDQVRPERALTLAGAATALRRLTGAVARSEQDRKLERTIDLASATCDPAVAEELWAAGSRMTADEAIRYALTSWEPETAQAESSPDPRGGAPPRSDPPGAQSSGRAPE
jgi:predicted ATPase